MTTAEFWIVADQVHLPDGVRPAAVGFTDGVITAIVEPAAVPAGALVTALPPDEVLLPGLVDSHVHVNEPGRTEWEGFKTATLAAAAGGVTTFVDMPLNSIPPTTSVEALEVKREAALPSAYVDVGFWGGVVPENLGQLAPLVEAGVPGFKCFLAHSGVDEFSHLSIQQLRAAASEIAGLGSRLIVHAEDPVHLTGVGPLGREYAPFLASRPPLSEASAILQVIDVVRATGCSTHILHVSDGRSLDLVRAAKAEGLPLTIETCPHYLTIRAEDIPDGASEFKCCPPIRGGDNRDLLWEGLMDGTIDAVVSDHSPSTVSLKKQGDGDFGLAWGGIASLQLSFAAVFTEATRRGIPLESILRFFTTGPAAIASLAGRGSLAVGQPAHLTAFAPADSHDVVARDLFHRNPITAYEGRELAGRTHRTWLAGEVVYDLALGGPGALTDAERPAPRGRLLSATAGAGVA